MKKLVSLVVCLSILAPLSAGAQAAPITRRDGFLLLWTSIRRATEPSGETPFADVARGTRGEAEITFAKSRGLLDDDEENFRPDDPLEIEDALLWLFRTRSLDPDGEEDFYDEEGRVYVPVLAGKFGLGRYIVDGPEGRMIKSGAMTEEELLTAMQFIDAYLVSELHESSLYAEKFHGKGTAFGETFDMNALTAAHRTFPKNTLVEVTNIENGKSVIVRINDRGPFVEGRDMDLSLAAFTSIAERSKGKINVRFRRLGDSTLVTVCNGSSYAVRLGRINRLNPGFPFTLPLGQTFSIGGSEGFVVRSIRYPDGTIERREDWILKDEKFRLTPSVTGLYAFRLSSKRGETREFQTRVVSCSN